MQMSPRTTARFSRGFDPDLTLHRASQLAMLVVGLAAFAGVLYVGRFVLAPMAVAVVVGLMLGPPAARLERMGVHSHAAAALVVVASLLVIAGALTAFAEPLRQWVVRAPAIWAELKSELSSLREPLAIISGLQDQIKEVTGADSTQMTVALEDNSTVTGLVVSVPAILGQIGIFLVGLFFFVATRNQIRDGVLRMCLQRRLRWRVAHVFRDVERYVSRFLISITLINIGEGIAVWLALSAYGVPAAPLWGALAGLLNYIPYIGPAAVALILFGVGLSTYDGIVNSLWPVIIYLGINFIEAQFVFPAVIGRTMTLNPFIVFLSLTFWLWIWGPVGGFVAVPALLVTLAVWRHIMPQARPVTMENIHVPERRTRINAAP
ncbi:AI-2E family transporter [Cucumibacter marinus]|uniref:AI-2E family transporter n=1 Tax=Cucumibacter marinus TaxID=1121252 RepID=UPI000684387D|nr:AI-2E family transporter [Cucumibacter marinus]